MPMLSWLIAWPANQLELYLEWHMSKSVIYLLLWGVLTVLSLVS
jgi:hypothetical protein